MADMRNFSSVRGGEPSTYLVFEGGFPTEGGWLGDEPDPGNPPGRDAIAFLLRAVDPTLPESEIWNEEGYGWSFNCRVGEITVNVLIQFTEHWLVIVQEVSLRPRFLRSPAYAEAVREVCARIERAVSEHPDISRRAWLTRSAYESLGPTADPFFTNA